MSPRKQLSYIGFEFLREEVLFVRRLEESVNNVVGFVHHFARLLLLLQLIGVLLVDLLQDFSFEEIQDSFVVPNVKENGREVFFDHWL